MTDRGVVFPHHDRSIDSSAAIAGGDGGSVEPVRSPGGEG